MKLHDQLTLITTGIATCTLVGSACASPMSSPDSDVPRKMPSLLGRGLSEWGIGSYGGTVSEIPVESANESENNAVAVGLNALETPSLKTTAAPEPTTTTDEGSTSWSTTIVTETVYVTVPPSTANTAAPTETPTPGGNTKRDGLPLQFGAGIIKGGKAIKYLRMLVDWMEGGYSMLRLVSFHSALLGE